MDSKTLRKKFLDYFKGQGHTILPSSPVVPLNDPSLLFINAGMNQFKDIFLGKDKRDYDSATTSQKCIRVGGKHNDLENVGHTRRHLTFFEMLGNFSFGAYGKKKAIQFAWELTTDVLEFEPERIWPSVYKDDDEAFELWRSHVPAERIVRFGEKENYWSMGSTGPCGPCSELLFDRGGAYGDATHPHEDELGERFLEIWNLVFMEQNTLPDGSQEKLPTPCIDTGMGLERVLSLKLDTETVFETDVLRSLMAEVENISGKKYSPSNTSEAAAFRVIADHLRCLAFAISDGAQPSNLDRGYVLRKILRRAVRYGKQLGLEKPFLAKILPRLVQEMGDAYPELRKNSDRIAELLTTEEENFQKTLKRGGALLSEVIQSAHTHGNEIAGDAAFKLKDTYGLPYEEILLLAKDEGLSVNTVRFHELEAVAKERSRKVHKETKQVAGENLFASYLEKNKPCHFSGYTALSGQAKITALLKEGAFVEILAQGEQGTVILDTTPFYAEQGGQVGDTGLIHTNKETKFSVTNTQSPYPGVIAHSGKIENGTLKVGQIVQTEVDATRRQNIANNHTATHLLQWALGKVLGEHVRQAGSIVAPDRLRFDFSHHKALSKKEIREIESLVNEKIRSGAPVTSYELDYSEVQSREDIKQFFGEKYLSKVRVIDIALGKDHSKELCGGTHTDHLGTIGQFRIIKEGSIAAGTRRIEAVSAQEAENHTYENEDLIENFQSILKAKPGSEIDRIKELLHQNKEMEKKLRSQQAKELSSLAKMLIEKQEIVGNLPLIVAQASIPPKALRDLCDLIQNQNKQAVIFLVCSDQEKCQMILQASPEAISKGIHAGKLIQKIAPIVGGKGGGKADRAQAGGQDPSQIEKLISEAHSKLTCSLSS